MGTAREVAQGVRFLLGEGYRVTTDLIERVRSGTWNPDGSEQDREQRNAMAARGYWQAFQFVQKSIAKVLKGVVDAEPLPGGCCRHGPIIALRSRSFDGDLPQLFFAVRVG